MAHLVRGTARRHCAAGSVWLPTSTLASRARRHGLLGRQAHYGEAD